MSVPFESRLRRQSRQVDGANGEINYEHNSWLEVGEKVTIARGNAEGVVVDFRADLLHRNQFVTLLLTNPDGSEKLVDVPASGVYRPPLQRS